MPHLGKAEPSVRTQVATDDSLSKVGKTGEMTSRSHATTHRLEEDRLNLNL
jgi:hypothetical protein